jgi:hypothetical protein
MINSTTVMAMVDFYLAEARPQPILLWVWDIATNREEVLLRPLFNVWTRVGRLDRPEHLKCRTQQKFLGAMIAPLSTDWACPPTPPPAIFWLENMLYQPLFGW